MSNLVWELFIKVWMSKRSWEEICKIFIIPEITPLASKKKLEHLGENPYCIWYRPAVGWVSSVWWMFCSAELYVFTYPSLPLCGKKGGGNRHIFCVWQGEFIPFDAYVCLILILLLCMKTNSILQRPYIKLAVN